MAEAIGPSMVAGTWIVPREATRVTSVVFLPPIASTLYSLYPPNNPFRVITRNFIEMEFSNALETWLPGFLYLRA
jgi:hypothetical protein